MSVIDWNISYRQRKNRKKQICFKINNRLLVDYFLEFDYDKKSYISPTKILNLIPEKNRKYFYLGLSDADGCVYINRKRGNYQYSISSTFEQDWAHMVDIFDCLDIRYNILKIERKNKSGNYNKYSQIRITNKKDVIKFLDYLYSTNFKGLKRKHRKYMIINTFLRYTKKEIKERKKRMIDDFLKFALNHIGISKEEFDKFVEDLKAGKIESYNNI